MLADPDNGYEMSLDEVEQFLNEITAISRK